MKLARYQLTKVFHWSQGKKETEKRPFCILRKKTGLQTLNPKPKSCTEFVLVIFSSHNCGLILCNGVVLLLFYMAASAMTNLMGSLLCRHWFLRHWFPYHLPHMTPAMFSVVILDSLDLWCGILPLADFLHSYNVSWDGWWLIWTSLHMGFQLRWVCLCVVAPPKCYHGDYFSSIS
jgi:hypothetical protein